MNTEVEHFSRRVRERRLELGVSQADISRLSGVSVHSVSDIETGKGNPTLESLRKVVGVLGMEIRIEPSVSRPPSSPESEES